LRALRLLKEINILICEDTRTAKKLLSMYEISVA
jgi:16S rRNA C1402 (ribose-2'-O) methylase RsmI